MQKGLSAKAYRRIVAAADHTDDSFALMDLEERPVGERRRLAAIAPPPVGDKSDSDGSVMGGGSGDDASEAASVVGGGDEDPPQPPSPAAPLQHPAEDIDVPDAISGARVQIIPGRKTRTHTYAARLGVKCTNESHPRCSKTRSLALLRDTLGSRCAEAFLGAWLAKAHELDNAAHMRYAPDVSAMRSYLADRP